MRASEFTIIHALIKIVVFHSLHGLQTLHAHNKRFQELKVHIVKTVIQRNNISILRLIIGMLQALTRIYFTLVAKALVFAKRL